MSELANAKNTVIQNALHLQGVNSAHFVTISRTLPAEYPRSSRCYRTDLADALCCPNNGMEKGPARQQAPDTDKNPDHHEGRIYVCLQYMPC